MKRWTPRVELSKQEKLIMKRLNRVRTLFGFLRMNRHMLFDDGFQAQLEAMYRQTGAGDEPLPPAMMCMVLLLQGYVGASDAEAVELAVMDLRWQMALDCLGAEQPPFSQGALQGFRERMIASELDRVLLERTVALVREGTATSSQGRALTKAVRVAIDSRPLHGAGRVEDTINLLGHSARCIVRIVSSILDCDAAIICRKAGIPLLLAPSVKAGLDLDWSDPRQKARAVETVERQVSSLHRWVERNLDAYESEPLRPYIEAMTAVREQDLEVTDGQTRIRQGVAPDRRISVEDAEMRHGRKSRSKRFDGYKEHIARDLDVPVIVACAVTPANRPEEQGARPISDDIARQGLALQEMHIDRAYVNSPVVAEVLARGGTVLAKPWGIRPARPGLFSKADFRIDLRSHTITCPAGEVESFEPGGDTVHFDPEACGPCCLRTNCTQAASGAGRSVSIANDEAPQQKYRKLQKSPTGRAALRERVAVEHSLAHVASRKGDKARYRGTRRNLFDLRRASAIQNLEALHRIQKEAA
ncbi:MAG: IS1182 family transposase [Myxococcota bacterium]